MIKDISIIQWKTSHLWDLISPVIQHTTLSSEVHIHMLVTHIQRYVAETSFHVAGTKSRFAPQASAAAQHQNGTTLPPKPNLASLKPLGSESHLAAEFKPTTPQAKAAAAAAQLSAAQLSAAADSDDPGHEGSATGTSGIV